MTGFPFMTIGIGLYHITRAAGSPLFFGLNGVWYVIPAAEFLALACTSTTLFVVIQKIKREKKTQER